MVLSKTFLTMLLFIHFKTKNWFKKGMIKFEVSRRLIYKSLQSIIFITWTVLSFECESLPPGGTVIYNQSSVALWWQKSAIVILHPRCQSHLWKMRESVKLSMVIGLGINCLEQRTISLCTLKVNFQFKVLEIRSAQIRRVSLSLFHNIAASWHLTPVAIRR